MKFTANELKMLKEGLHMQMGCQCPESAYWHCECRPDIEDIPFEGLLKRLEEGA